MNMHIIYDCGCMNINNHNQDKYTYDIIYIMKWTIYL